MQKYKRVKKVSEGAFGTVYEYQNVLPSSQIPDTKVAIKQIFSSSNNVKRQLQILKDLPYHKNILKIHQILQGNFHVNIVMELGKYDLGTFIDQASYPIEQSQVKKVAYQLLQGLKVLHDKGYIHRDLKPGNVIINDQGYLRLCDFGSAVKCSKGQQYELQGFTRWYKPPEMLYGYRSYRYEVDVWSLGCILMQFATGQPYFDGKSQIQQLSLITRELGNPTTQNWSSLAKMPDYGKINFKPMPQKSIEQMSQQRGISKQLATFLKKMIKYDRRSSVQELLSDIFLQQISQKTQLLTMPSVSAQSLTKQIRESYDSLKKMIKNQIKQC